MKEARDLDFPIQENIRRLHRIQGLMADTDLDALFLTMRDNVEVQSG
ncbi:MAG TPA: hypothetical protein VMX75_14255 [Spirochaetia bacterium]|nr:hypothetical protein [Spirochaetia bacterium]